MKNLLGLVGNTSGLLALLVLGCWNQAVAQDFSYNTLSLSYLQVDTDVLDSETNYEFTGIEAQGRIQLSDALFLGGAISQIDNDDFQTFEPSLTRADVSLGVVVPVAAAIDVYGTLGYAKYEVEFGALQNLDDTGLLVGVGARAFLTDSLELEGGVKSSEVDSRSDTVFDLVVRFHEVSFVAPELRFQSSNATTGVGIGIHLSL